MKKKNSDNNKEKKNSYNKTEPKISDMFFVIVGLGGVGSNFLSLLLRLFSPKKLRLVDFDILTLSSLNRHATATREDVGRKKVSVGKEMVEKLGGGKLSGGKKVSGGKKMVEKILGKLGEKVSVGKKMVERLSGGKMGERLSGGKFWGKLGGKKMVEKIWGKNNSREIEVEVKDEILSESNFDNNIKEGNPDFVIDCIDDIQTKAKLFRYCYINNIKLISSMGAGGKTDIGKICIERFNIINYENLARKLRNEYRNILKRKIQEEYKSNNNNINNINNINNDDIKIPSFPCVYSTELVQRPLLSLSSDEKKKIEILKKKKKCKNERIRILPVFACVPIAFGSKMVESVVREICEEIRKNKKKKEKNGSNKI